MQEELGNVVPDWPVTFYQQLYFKERDTNLYWIANRTTQLKKKKKEEIKGPFRKQNTKKLLLENKSIMKVKWKC